MSFQTVSSSSSSSSSLGCEILRVPFELHVYILTYLRATDLSAVHRTCLTFHDSKLVHSTIQHFATRVYPPELTEGFDTPIVGGEVSIATNDNDNDNSSSNYNSNYNYEALRNMEMLVVARVLSRPEPPLSQRESGFYVSKSWCRAALRWLEVQAEERKQRETASSLSNNYSNNNSNHSNKKHGGGKRQHKRSKKQERMRRRKLSDASPPWPNVNHDLTCHHGDLRCSNVNHTHNNTNNINNNNHNNTVTSPGSRAERAKRRVMDKQAWRILKKLYPDSVQLSLVQGECVHCALQVQTDKITREAHNQKLMQQRKKPLACPLVRAFYTRTRGVPTHSLSHHNLNNNNNNNTLYYFSNGAPCPLVQGVYHALPRSWCHRWRKYLKTGEGGRPCAPDASACLCDGHNLPLVPPHLESFLYGDTPALLSTLSNTIPYPHQNSGMNINTASPTSTAPPDSFTTPITTFPSNNVYTLNTASSSSSTFHDTTQMLASLRASGLSDVDIQAQRYAMMQIESQNRHSHNPHHRHTLPSTPPPPHNNRNNNNNNNNHGHATTPPPTTTTATATPTTPDANTNTRAEINAQLDRENYVVVEILTDEEFTALEKWWPEIHSSYALRFAVTTTTTHNHNHNIHHRHHDDDNDRNAGLAEIVWTTPPCRECDASGIFQNHHLVVRNRNRNLNNKKTLYVKR